MDLKGAKLWLGITTMGAVFITTFEGLQTVLPHIQGTLSLTANITLGTVDVLIPGGAALLLSKGVVWVHSSWQRNKLLSSDHKHVALLHQGSVTNISAETEQWAAIGRSGSAVQRQISAPNAETEILNAVTLPQRSVPFSVMHHHITAQQEVLGWDGQRWITASPDYTLSVGCIGRPGSGKTSLLRYFVASAVQRGAEISGWDMHGDIVRELGAEFRILDTPSEILEDAAWVIEEIERRTILYKGVYKRRDEEAIHEWANLPELFHLIDEFTALMTALKRDKKGRELCQDALLRLITEGRKLKMRTVISGQSLPADIFGGSGARDNLQTRYAFGAEPEQARMLGIPEAAISELLPLVGGEDSKGYAVLCGGPLKSAVIVSVPYTTVQDISAVMYHPGNIGPGNSALLAYSMTQPFTDPVTPVPVYTVPQNSAVFQWEEPMPEVTAEFSEWWDIRAVRCVGADTASWECWKDYCDRCTHAGIEPMASGDFAKELKRAAESAGCKANNNSGLKLDKSRGQRSGWTGLSLQSE